MANADNIFPLACNPGIQRDGTTLDSDNYIDGQWCRFTGRRGRPQKMGGYRKMFAHVGNIPRGIFVVPSSPLPHIYIGDATSVKYYPTDKTTGLVAGPPVDRTPALFNANTDNLWSFDLMFDANSDSSIIIASAPKNLYSIEQEVEAPIYYGKTDSNDQLIETGFYASGGFVMLHPILFIFGNDGFVSYTQPNDPTTVLNTARVAGTKIIAGRSTRGGQNSPAGLLWSLDSLIRVSNVGASEIEFSFDTISSSCTLLSSNAIIQYNSMFYWVGTDNFYMYNGVVTIWPNSMSIDYFFKRLNFSQRQKVWLTKNKRYNEIWIHYPSGSSSECDKTLIYSSEYEVWYDSSISRGYGVYSQIFGSPIWMDNTPQIDTIRNLGGTPFSSPGGVAINAFDGDINTSCAQSGPNGYISYTWGAENKIISDLGIISFINANYTLRAQYSYDGINWTNNDVLILPTTAFQQNVLQWFSIQNPVAAPYFRIIETGGSTLNIAELYFNSKQYIVWQHETDVDQVIDDVHTAIPSHFEMSVMSWASKGPGGQNTAMNKTLFLYSLEPDFLQSGDMQLIVKGREFANSPVTSSTPYIFNNDVNSVNFTEKIDIREKRRLMTLRFESNSIEGDYEMGSCLLVPREGDVRA